MAGLMLLVFYQQPISSTSQGDFAFDDAEEVISIDRLASPRSTTTNLRVPLGCIQF